MVERPDDRQVSRPQSAIVSIQSDAVRGTSTPLIAQHCDFCLMGGFKDPDRMVAQLQAGRGQDPSTGTGRSNRRTSRIRSIRAVLLRYRR